MGKQRSEILGPIPTEALKVVARAWLGGFRVQSDFARENAVSVGLAASLGLITTINEGEYGGMWRPTSKGLLAQEANWEARR